MTKRKEDTNGWFEIKGNPISKVGVFEYLGAQIGAPDKTRIYKVYRPAEELSKPETIESFKLLPFINDHEMLGPNVGFLSAEEKGVEGVVGENITFEAPYLKANIKVFSEQLRDAIEAGKVDLSCGYCCEYEFTSGTYQGQHYDAIQRHIRGNHLALVEEGRMGKDVRVLDHLKLDLTTKDNPQISDKPKMEKQELLAKLAALTKAIEQNKITKDEQTMIDALNGVVEDGVLEDTALEDNTIEDDDIIQDEEELAADFEDIAGDENPEQDENIIDEDIIDEIVSQTLGKTNDDIKINGMDAALRKALKNCGVKLTKAKNKSASHKSVMDTRALVNEIAKRDRLANRLSTLIGTFNHTAMTAQDVANYGAKKLGLKARGRAAMLALDGYLVANQRLSNKNFSIAQDTRIRSNALSNYIKGNK